MQHQSRREFLAEVGNSMLLASMGVALAQELGVADASADGPERLHFGKLEPLVAFMQETPPGRLLPQLVEKHKAGVDVRTLVAAGALANARTFGGQDYVGFHAFMALAPAVEMARELPEREKLLPVLKVLYRNSARIQERGGRKNEVLLPVEPGTSPGDRNGGEVLREATRKADFAAAERLFASQVKDSPGEAFNHLQYAVQDEVDVHRVVLAWRAWVSLDLTGPEHAHTLLRQSVRYCVQHEQRRQKYKHPVPDIRHVLPRLMEAHRLLDREAGRRGVDDAWVEKLAELIYRGTREQAAEAAAAALAEGIAPDCVGEAVCLAANLLVLRDAGRRQADGAKGVGSVHGDSVGVHASDAANAWRNIARVSKPRNTFASLIVGAFHTAGQSGGQLKQGHPLPEQLEKVSETDGALLLRAADEAIRDRDQARVAAVIQRYGMLGLPARPVFDLLLRYTISEDGALHAEKYYRAVCEEFAATRPAFRWRQLVALARVTASEYGHPAAGYAEACQLIK